LNQIAMKNEPIAGNLILQVLRQGGGRDQEADGLLPGAQCLPQPVENKRGLTGARRSRQQQHGSSVTRREDAAY
jgi:hypothetical protein